MPGMESLVRPTFGLGNVQQVPGNVPGQAPTFGDLFNPQKVAMRPPGQAQPQTLQDVLGGSDSSADMVQKQAEQPPSASPQPTTQQKIAKDNVEIDKLQREVAKDPIDEILGKVEKDLGPNPPSADQFDPNGKVDSNSEAIKLLGARMRENLASNSDESMRAFQSMFGKDNVKVYRGKIYYKAGDNQKFKPVDSEVFGSVIDWTLKHVSGLPGLAANVGTQATLDTAAGLPTGGSGSVATAASNAAIGGMVGTATDYGVKKLVDQFSDIPMSQNNAQEAKEFLGDASFNALSNAGFTAVAGPLMGAVAKTGKGMQITQKFNDALSGLTKDEAGQVVEAGPTIQKLAQVRGAVKEFKDYFFPSIANDAGETGKTIGSAVDKIGTNLEKNVELVKKQALARATETGQEVQKADTFLSKLKDTLSDQGVSFDKSGYTIRPEKEALNSFEQGAPNYISGDGSVVNTGTKSKTEYLANQNLNPFSSPTGKQTLESLMNYHDQYMALSQSKGGVDLNKMLRDVDFFSNMARYDQQTNPIKDSEIAAFKDLRKALAADRNDAFTQLFQGSNLPAEKTWLESLNKYHQNIDAIGSFQNQFATPQQREKLIDTLVKSDNANRLEMLDNLQQVLGGHSKEWNSLRGDLVDQMVRDKMLSGDGVINPKAVLSYLHDNDQWVSRVFNKSELSVFKRMMIEASNISTGNSLSPEGKKAFESGFSWLSKMKNPTELVKSTLSMFGGDKKAVDYLLNEGFVDMANRADSATQKENILTAMRYMDEVTSKMKVIDVETGTQKGSKRVVQKYAPFVSSTVARGFDNTVSKMGQRFNPQEQAPAKDPIDEILGSSVSGPK